MSRPREFAPGGVYHFGSRGSNKEPIYFDGVDRDNWTRLFARVCARNRWVVLTHTQMKNHFHVVARIPGDNLSVGMRELNSVYSRRTNARHGRKAHLFENRFWSELIETREQQLTALGYVDVNIYKASRIHPRDWPHGSYRALVGDVEAPSFLAVDEVLGLFSRRPATAVRLYREFVEAAMARVDRSRAQARVTEL